MAVTIPTPDEAFGAAQAPSAVNPAQIDPRVAHATGQAGHAWQNALEAVGGAFGEIAGRVAQTNDATAEARAKLDWYKADQENWRNLAMGAQQDGTGWEKAPSVYDQTRQSILDKYPISNPQQRQKLDLWMQHESAQRGFSAADQKQKALGGYYTGIEDKEITGAVQSLQSDPSQQNYDKQAGALQALVDSGRGLYHSNGSADARKAQIQGALLMGQYQALLRSDPDAAAILIDKIRRGEHELQGGQNYIPPNGSQPSRMTFPVPGINPDDVPRSGGAENSREHMGPRGGGNHAGWDIPGQVGSPVVAAGDGVVIKSGEGQGYGSYVDIQMADGTIHRMAHLGNTDKGGNQQGIVPGIAAGTQVKQGQQIGALGYSGNAGKEFPHVHYEVFPDKAAYDKAQGQSSRASADLRINPRDYFAKANGLGVPAANDNVSQPSSVTGGGIDRSAFSAELQKPEVRDRLLALTEAEVGNQGPEAHQAFMETIFNRASARGQSLWDTMHGSYFPDVTHQRTEARSGDPQLAEKYGRALQSVVAGSNTSDYATGNASGTVGFAGGPQTKEFNGERFGIEGPDRKWADEARKGGAAPPVAQRGLAQYAGLGGPKGVVSDASNAPAAEYQGGAQAQSVDRAGLPPAANPDDILKGSQHGGSEVGDDTGTAQQPGQQGNSATIPTPQGQDQGAPQQGQQQQGGLAADLREQIQGVHDAAKSDPGARLVDSLPQDLVDKVREMLPGLPEEGLANLTMGQASQMLEQIVPSDASGGMGMQEFPLARLKQGQTFSVKSKFGDITVSADALNALGLDNKNKKALDQMYRQAVEGQRFKWQSDIKDDLKQIEQTGIGKSDAEIAKWIKSGPGRLPNMKNQIQAYQEKRVQMKMAFDAASGIETMSPEDAIAQIQAYNPARPGVDQGGARYNQLDYAYQHAYRKLQAVQKMRDQDPVTGVSGGAVKVGTKEVNLSPAPEIENAKRLLGPGDLTPNGQIMIGPGAAPTGPAEAGAPDKSKRIEFLIENRLAAQQRVGVYTASQRTITKAEADDLLRLGDPKDLSDQQISDGMKAAWGRAQQTYGSYAPRVLEDAVKLTKHNDVEKDAAARIVGPIVRGEAKALEEAKRGPQQSWSSYIGGMFGGGAKNDGPMGPPAPAWATGANPGKDAPSAPSAPQAPSQPAPPPAPTAKHKAWLKNNPEGRSAYEAKFGKGSAKEILEAN